MQAQTLITENGKDYLVIALPTVRELFDYGFVSRSEKSFVFRKWTHDYKTLLRYQSFRLNTRLIKGRFINHANKHYHKGDIISHAFNGIGLPSIKIPLSKV